MNKKLGTFDVVLMGVISMIGLRNIPITAKYGNSIILVYFIVVI